jgi:hypothetical protein
MTAIEFFDWSLSLLSIIGDRSKWLITTYRDFHNGDYGRVGASVGDTNPRTIAASSDSPAASSILFLMSLSLERTLTRLTHSYSHLAQQQQPQCACRAVHFDVRFCLLPDLVHLIHSRYSTCSANYPNEAMYALIVMCFLSICLWFSSSQLCGGFVSRRIYIDHYSGQPCSRRCQRVCAQLRTVPYELDNVSRM